jgi:hypothetical protein
MSRHTTAMCAGVMLPGVFARRLLPPRSGRRGLEREPPFFKYLPLQGTDCPRRSAPLMQVTVDLWSGASLQADQVRFPPRRIRELPRSVAGLSVSNYLSLGANFVTLGHITKDRGNMPNLQLAEPPTSLVGGTFTFFSLCQESAHSYLMTWLYRTLPSSAPSPCVSRLLAPPPWRLDALCTAIIQG